jgi:hypothetical protein
MTAPVGQGFPDYQRNRPAANVVYYRASETINANKFAGTFWVAYYSSININWLSIAGRCTLLFDFYADQGLTQFLQQTSISIGDTQVVEVAIPIKGPWCQVTLFLGSASFNYQLFLSGVPESGIIMGGSNSNILVASGITAILAGATQTFLTGTWPGRAHLTMSQLVGAWHGEVNYIDNGGTAHRMFAYDSGGGTQVREMICLPHVPVSVTLTNTSGAGSQCQVYLIGDLTAVYSG